ncbi:MAG: ShlB/FhaC/HecB family hemolysin secretion/activation protein, partial [Rhodospirillales bacterium]|nr:ShlB/FhaC/HecB family hemolysin secretion/activation protein [Rhodospirillales bacterium]
VILIFVKPDGTITPAQVVNVEGQVAAVEKIADSSIVWAKIDAEGTIKPLQVEPDGSLVPARASPDGKPLVPGEVPKGLTIFAAQVSVNGRLLPILRTVEAGFPLVTVTSDKRIVAYAAPPSKAPPVEKALSGSLAADNSGSGATGLYNLTASLAHKDLWGLKHTGTVAVTTSATDPEASKLIVGSYTVPVSGLVEKLQDSLSVSGFYYDLKYENQTATQSTPAKFKLKGYAISPNYMQNLFLSISESGSQTVHSASYGFTISKSWTKDFGFGQDDQTSIVRMPLSISYSFANASNSIGLLNLGFGYIRNLPVGAAGDGADYRRDRANSDPRYGKFNFNLTHGFDWKSGWSISSAVFGQYAKEPMITSEGFALGGPTSVRGLEDAKTIGDKGTSGQLKLTAPDVLSMAHYSSRFFTFVDGGWVKKIRPPEGDPGTESAVSVGAGVELKAPANTFLNFTVGWLAGGSAVGRYQDDDGRVQLYLNASINF